MLSLLLIACATLSAPDATVQLFNGQDLTNLYTFVKERGKNVDPNAVFTVHDGMLHISGEEYGCVTTNDEFENYRLVVEFKWGEKTWTNRIGKARDSGVLIHSTGDDGAFGGVWMRSIECQMIEGGTGDILVVGDKSEAFAVTCPVAKEKQGESYVYQPDGQLATIHDGRINWFGRDPEWKDEQGYRGRQDVEKPLGEWNVYEIVADGPSIVVTLNGVVVNRAFNSTPHRGKIQIQSEGAELFVRRMDLTPLPKPAEQHARRFIYNSDASNMFIEKQPPMRPEDVHPYVDEAAGTLVTSFFISPNYGMPVIYPGKAAELIGTNLSPALADTLKDLSNTPPMSTERAIANLRALIDAGHDPLAVIIDRAKERGLEAFVSFRLNEVHSVEESDSLIFTKFWKDHPEWRIGKAGDPLPDIYLQILGPNTSPIVAGWLPGGLDFAVPEVRAQRLAELRECCERYNLDGLDLDFQRFPMYFKPGKETENVATMTAWVRDVRAMTREVGEKRGRPILLSARIMARPEQNLAIGLDPITWAREGQVDFLIASHYLRNDYPLPVAEYRRLLPGTMPLYASIEVAKEEDTYRRIARRLWDGGADGIMLFNFFTSREGGKEPPFALLKELGDPAKIVY
ncbi:MAG: DUF1080 domain-containing protein [FCB group bacterium]|jgi:hypothetical protein|nr:DUF1080 domain-containing protein [FCB group bacterium]